MADTQVKNETTLATHTGNEVVYVVGDPGGTPVDRKSTLKDLRLPVNQGTVALTDQATIAIDCATGNFFTLTLGGSRTFGAPTNGKAGATYLVSIRQDGTGSRVATWNAAYKFPGGTDGVLTTTASAVDLLSIAYDGTDYLCVLSNNHA
jgi:hypothetical protein